MGKKGHFFSIFDQSGKIEPETEFPASIALKVPEPHKPNHCIMAMSNGEVVNQQLVFLPVI